MAFWTFIRQFWKKKKSTNEISKSIFIPREKLGHPGIRYDLILTPLGQMKVKDQEKGSWEIKDNSERDFELTGTFSKQLNLSKEFDLSSSAEKNSSFLLLPNDVDSSVLMAENIQLEFKTNCKN